MRVGLDLRGVDDPGKRLALANEADRLGLWAVLIGGQPGTEATEAAAMAVKTSSIHLAVFLDGRAEHPLTLAEEIAVVDHLSQRRALAVVDGPADRVTHVDRLLAGHVVDGVTLAPPPAQTRVPVWAADELSLAPLTGDLKTDSAEIDRRRDDGCTHLFVTWDGPLPRLARHLVTRAAGPGFPEIVAEMADRIDPPADAR